MSNARPDRPYHANREMAEHHAASVATKPEARLAHTRLAELHAALRGRNGAAARLIRSSCGSPSRSA